MKHILPILTAALALTATTASAAYYYDYYGTSDPTSNRDLTYDEEGKSWTKHEVDTVTYKDFRLDRITQQNNYFAGGQENFYRITITGNNVDIYLTDYIGNIEDYGDGTPYNSNSIANMGVTHYGYRLLDADGNVISKTETIALPANPEVIDSGEVTYQDKNGNTQKANVNRYKYSLGRTFNNGEVIELYMKDSGGEAYSYNPNPEDTFKTDDKGGFADGYTVSGASTDKLLYLYYGKTAEESRRAMPLAALDLGADGTNRVYFGIYAQAAGTVGSPLPGGLQIALVAGLFGLGFWYIRRRKAIAA